MVQDARIRELVSQHQGLVRSVAHTIAQLLPPRMEMDDLISYGQIGLAEAANEYDGERGTQFSTYAYYRVRGAILDGAYQMSWYNRAQIKRLKHQRLVSEALRAQRENEMDQDDPLDNTSRSVARLVVVGLALDAADAQMDFADVGGESPEDGIAKEEAFRLLEEAIERLPEDECELIRAAYFRGDTLSAIASRAGKHKSWASRLHDKALDRLASELRSVGVAE